MAKRARARLSTRRSTSGLYAGMPARMMVAVETIKEANISVSPTLPNSSAGERICA